jgi:hypothetical protein
VELRSERTTREIEGQAKDTGKETSSEKRINEQTDLKGRKKEATKKKEN